MYKCERWSIGILAYGSLIDDPGDEISPLIIERIPTKTPFAVEFARISSSRGLAPTVVPHPMGNSVRAEVLVLDNSISIANATDMLWRREIHQVGSGKVYQASNLPNQVLVKNWQGHAGVDDVLYTDFNDTGKLPEPDAEDLAGRAINSVKKAKSGKDGINYLIALKKHGVQTRLSNAYEAAILRATGAPSLEVAVIQLRTIDGRKEQV